MDTAIQTDQLRQKIEDITAAIDELKRYSAQFPQDSEVEQLIAYYNDCIRKLLTENERT